MQFFSLRKSTIKFNTVQYNVSSQLYLFYHNATFKRLLCRVLNYYDSMSRPFIQFMPVHFNNPFSFKPSLLFKNKFCLLEEGIVSHKLKKTHNNIMAALYKKIIWEIELPWITIYCFSLCSCYSSCMSILCCH